MDAYEVQIRVNLTDAAHYYVDHRFPSLPEPETLKLLLAEAKTTFELLHETEHDYASVAVVRLEAANDTPSGSPAGVGS